MPTTHTPVSPRRLATIAEAADYMRVSYKTMRRHIAAGRITGYTAKGSHLIRVDLNEVDTVLLRPMPTAAG